MKISSILLITCIATVLTIGAMLLPTYANEPSLSNVEQVDYRVIFMIDGEFVLRAGIVCVNDTLFVHADVLFYNLGSVSDWDIMLTRYYQADPSVFVLANQHITFEAGSNIVHVNGEAITLESAPFMYNGLLYIPLIEVAHLTGQAVEHRVEGHRQLVALTPYSNFNRDVVRFIIALDANGIIRSRDGIGATAGNLSRPAGVNRSQRHSTRTRTTLNTGWNITNRESALRVIYNLYAGGQNARYMAQHAEAGTTSPWGDAGILAFDFARVVQVASHSFVAGYLTFEELLELSLPAAITLQYHFDSWEEKGENFVYGATFWLRGANNETRGINQRQQAHELFVREYVETLPPWDLVLPSVMSVSEVPTLSQTPLSDTPRTLRFAIGNTTFTDNGTPYQLEAAPFIANERTMVPLRVIVEALGATDVAFVDGVVTFSIDGQNFTMTIDQPLPGNMGTPALINQRTFVPLAFIVTEIGAEVRWDGDAFAAYVYIG